MSKQFIEREVEKLVDAKTCKLSGIDDVERCTLLRQALQTAYNKGRSEERERVEEAFRSLCHVTTHGVGECKYFKKDIHERLLEGDKFAPEHILRQIIKELV